MRNPISVVAKTIVERKHTRSDKWPEVRKKWLEQNPKCAACGSVKDLQVHHIKPFHVYPELELDPTNFITLCETMGTEHHLKVGHTVPWPDGHSSWKINNSDVREDAQRLMRNVK